MRTIQTYECPVHGYFDRTVDDSPSTVTCCQVDHDNDSGPCSCIRSAEWRPSAPAVRTQDTQARALSGHVRSTNPW